jgi:hypothetical protein
MPLREGLRTLCSNSKTQMTRLDLRRLLDPSFAAREADVVVVAAEDAVTRMPSDRAERALPPGGRRRRWWLRLEDLRLAAGAHRREGRSRTKTGQDRTRTRIQTRIRTRILHKGTETQRPDRIRIRLLCPLVSLCSLCSPGSGSGSSSPRTCVRAAKVLHLVPW